MENQYSGYCKKTVPDSPGCGQNGSVIVIALMLLVIMSIIGISSTNITVTENFIVRNAAIRKQNLNLVDAAAMEVYQTVIDAAAYDNPADPDEFINFADNLHHANSSTLDWFHDMDTWETANQADWYNPAHVGRILIPGNSEVPQSIIDGDIDLLNQRGEWDGDPDNSPIRYAFAGWRLSMAGDLESIGVNKPGSERIEIGHIFVEYVSARSGVFRLIVGVRTRTG